MLRVLPPIAHFLPPIDGMMDVFDAALTCSFGAEVNAPAAFQSMARSQDLLHPSQDDAALETISEEEACDAFTIATKSTDCADAPKHAKTPSPSSPRKRPLSKSAKKDPTSSRVRNADKSCRIKPLGEGDATQLQYVFIKHHTHGRQPIPLWGAYNAVWDVKDVQDVSFIKVGTREHWLKRLVDSQTKKHAREVAAAFVDSFRLTFNDCLNNARSFTDDVENVLDNELPGGVDNTDSLARFKKTKWAGVVKLDICGHSVHCLNNAAMILLKLDVHTIEFIASWVAPLVKELAETHVRTGGSKQSLGLDGGSKNVSSLANQFQFASLPTPNVRDKVCWEPTHHAWRVHVQKPKGMFDASDFTVDPGLCGKAYDAAKLTVYRDAVDTWNRLDGTTRARIPTSLVATTPALE